MAAGWALNDPLAAYFNSDVLHTIDFATVGVADWAHPLSVRDNGTVVPCKAIGDPFYDRVLKVLPRAEAALTECIIHYELNATFPGRFVRPDTFFLNAVHFAGGRSEERYMVAMQRCAYTLENLGVVNEQTALQIIRDVMVSVASMHSIGMVHRDIKSDNIFFDANHNVLVGDFGWARRVNSGRVLSNRFGEKLHRAPEAESGLYDYGVDVYSIGVMLFKMLTGRAPFDLRHIQHKRSARHVIQQLRAPALAHVSQNTKDLLLKLLDPNWRARPSLLSLLRTHPSLSPLSAAVLALGHPLPVGAPRGPPALGFGGAVVVADFIAVAAPRPAVPVQPAGEDGGEEEEREEAEENAEEGDQQVDHADQAALAHVEAAEENARKRPHIVSVSESESALPMSPGGVPRPVLPRLNGDGEGEGEGQARKLRRVRGDGSELAPDLLARLEQANAYAPADPRAAVINDHMREWADHRIAGRAEPFVYRAPDAEGAAAAAVAEGVAAMAFHAEVPAPAAAADLGAGAAQLGPAGDGVGGVGGIGGVPPAHAPSA